MKPTTLLLASSATGDLAMELGACIKSKPGAVGNCIRIVERSRMATMANAVVGVAAGGDASHEPGRVDPDCIATNLGAAFVLMDSPSKAIPKLGSFRVAFLILFPGVFDSPDAVLAVNQVQHAILTLAHNYEEAAEFIINIVIKLSDDSAKEQARKMVSQAYERPFEDLKRTVFETVERGLPIPAAESRAMLESLGSLGALAKCESVGELVSRTPLSNRDASTVAAILGIPSNVAEWKRTSRLV